VRISTGSESGHPPENSERSDRIISAISFERSTTVTDAAPFLAAVNIPSVPLNPNCKTAGRSTIRYATAEGK